MRLKNWLHRIVREVAVLGFRFEGSDRFQDCPKLGPLLISILTTRRLAIARHNFDFVDLDQILYVTKFDILQHKRPDVITESVGLQVTSLLDERKRWLVNLLNRTAWVFVSRRFGVFGRREITLNVNLVLTLVDRPLLMHLSNASMTFNAICSVIWPSCRNSSMVSCRVWPSVVFLYNW